MMRDKLTSKLKKIKNFSIEKFRGFGFITFKDNSVLEKVLEEKHVLMGCTVNFQDF